VGEIGLDQIALVHAFGNVHTTNLHNREIPCQALDKCVNDEEQHFMWNRSQITCRSVYFIGDGKAHLCLGTVDPVPVANTSVVQVAECSRFLIKTDYLDGYLDLMFEPE